MKLESSEAITLFVDAACKWGAESQFRQFQEELCECAAAVNRLARKRDGALEELVDEVADVLITTAQARILLDAQLIDAAVTRKLERLSERVYSDEREKASGKQ